MRYLNLVKNVKNWPSYLAFKMGINAAGSVPFRLRQKSLTLTMIPSMKPLFREIFLKEVYAPALKSVLQWQLLPGGGRCFGIAFFAGQNLYG
ncbi:hypothetical protein GCM10023091_14170 [Ravibacter arvi]|uniref:Uncharacterized protein n=1 Tax=Ravibacter arvi TaxID=2051041 RepID=A0ABP8LVA9_9BACT